MAKIEVGIIMGSQSDWPTMKEAADMLDALKVPYETKIVSAHRTPDRLWDYGKNRGLSWLESDHRRGWRCRTFARYDGVENPCACCGCARADQGTFRRR